MLRLVAEEADTWNCSAGNYAELDRKVAVLREHCAAVGRDPNTIERSAGVRGSGAALLRRANAFVELGVTFLTVEADGPGYDLGGAEALCRWRDGR